MTGSGSASWVTSTRAAPGSATTRTLTAGLAALTGAQPDEVVAMNSLTVNLHLMLASFYRPAGERRRILIEAGAFSSDRHAVASQIAWHGLDPARDADRARPARRRGHRAEARHRGVHRRGRRADRAGAVAGGAVPHRAGVRSGAHRARGARAGCVAGFDLAHSIGNVPLALHDDDADFAVWCSYKYLNAGPGAIGGCFVHERHAEAQPRSAPQRRAAAAARRLVGSRGVHALSDGAAVRGGARARRPGR